MAAANPVDRVMDRVSRLHEVITDDIERLLRSDMSGMRYATYNLTSGSSQYARACVHTEGENNTRVWPLMRATCK